MRILLKSVQDVSNKNYILNYLKMLHSNQDWNHIAKIVEKIVLENILDKNLELH